MTVAERPTITGAVDTDLHVAPATMDVLLPYLDEYWQSYIDDATIRLGGISYPDRRAGRPGRPRRARTRRWPRCSTARSRSERS